MPVIKITPLPLSLWKKAHWREDQGRTSQVPKHQAYGDEAKNMSA